MEPPRSILLAYSTTDGHTRTICTYIQAQLQQRQLHVHMVPLAQANSMSDKDIARFDVVVLGASIRYGRHQPEVLRFANRHAPLLNQLPGIFFSVSAIARKPHRRTVETNPYVKRFLNAARWKPQHVAMLAGKIDYPRYCWLDRQIIRCIMHLTGGPTDIRQTTEFTDWTQVHALAEHIAALAAQPRP